MDHQELKKRTSRDEDVRLVRHRLADARWRSNVSSCYSLLKEVVLQKGTWDPECAVPIRASKVTILNETGEYIKKLEEIVSEELEVKAIRENSGPTETLQKIRADFLRLESSKFIHKEDVGPYVEQYLQILAKQELCKKQSERSKKLPERSRSKSAEEDATGSIMVFHPYTGALSWRVPNFTQKIRRKYKNTCRPTIVNLLKETQEGLLTPRRLTEQCSYPPIRSKNVKVSGCGRPGVKRRLLEAMELIEDSNSEPVATSASSSQETTDDVNEELESAVSDDSIVPEFLSFTKILPAETQNVPCIEYEVEVTTTEGAGKENMSSQLDCVAGRKPSSRKRKPLQVVPDTLATPKRPKAVLGEISTENIQEDKCIVPPSFCGKRSENSAFQEYTALKNAMTTPEKQNTLVKFGPVFGISPSTSEMLMTQDDPLLTCPDSDQPRSPGAFQMPVAYGEENVRVVPEFPSPNYLWTSPSTNVLCQEAFDTQFFGGFFFHTD